MKRLINLLFALFLCVSLASCAAGSGSAADVPDLTGKYEIFKMVDDEEGDMADQLALLKQYGMNIYLTLNEDNTGELDMFGEKIELSYDAEKMTMSADGFESSPFKYEDDTIIMRSGESEMSFKKMSAEDIKKMEESTGDQTEASQEETPAE